MANNLRNPHLSRLVTSISSAPLLTEGISFILSVLVFFLIKVRHYLTAYSDAIIIISIIAIVVSAVLWSKHKAFRFVLFFFLPILALSAYSKNRFAKYERKASENELVADATNCGSAIFNDQGLKMLQESYPWFMKAAQEDQILYILIPSRLSPEAIGKNALDRKKMQVDSPDLEMRMLVPQYKFGGTQTTGEYIFAGLYKPHMKDNYTFKRCKVLDESVAVTLRGMVSMAVGDYVKAKELFEKADSMKNAVATMQLSAFYASGIVVPRDIDKAIELENKAAASGSRAARVSRGMYILRDTSSTALETAEAEDYLRRAALVNSLVSSSISRYSQEATDQLCEYYWHTKRYEDAYQLTKQCTESSFNPNVLFFCHLYNCIYTNRLDEAKKIILQGEEMENPNAFILHAEMLRTGEGFDKDLPEAERLMKHALSLHPDPANGNKTASSKAYYSLEQVYLEASDSLGAHFWRRLADINFKGGVDDEN